MKKIMKMLAFVGVFISVLVLTGTQSLASDVVPFVGINYGPYHFTGQSPDIGTKIPTNQFIADLDLMYQKNFRYIRTYAVDKASGLDGLVPLINVNRDKYPNLKIWIGVFESSQYRNETVAELATAINLANKYPNIIQGVVVGNEWSDKDFAPGPVTVDQMKADLQQVRNGIPNKNILVTTCFGFNAALDPATDQQGRTLNGHYPGESYAQQLLPYVDNIMFTSYPFFAGVDVSAAYADSTYWYNYAVNLFPGKQVIMGELGWPTGPPGANQPFQNPNPPAPPPPPNPAVPSVANAQTYDTALLNNQDNPDKLGPVFLFETFDEPWKKGDTREPYWGLWTWTDPNTSPIQKFPFTVPGFPQARLLIKQWIGPNPNSLWSNPDNWDPAGVPEAGDDVLLAINTGSQTVLYDVTAPHLNSLAIDATGGGTITLQQSGNDLDTGGEVVGRGGQGIHNQYGGHNMVDGYLILGRDAGSRGTYNLNNNGSLEVTFLELIGNSGTGSFNQFNGSHTVADTLVIGAADNASGSYQLYNGRLEVVEEVIGIVNGTGSFKQFGGTHAVDGTLTLGLLNGSGTYQLLGGSLSVGNEFVGDNGTGVFSQTGGSHLVADALTLGTDGGSGTYNLTSGNLEADREFIGRSNPSVGPGSGSFTHTAGANTTSGLWLGLEPGDTGAYTLISGKLSAQTEFVGVAGSGAFTQTGGTNAMNLGLILGANAGGSGTYDLKSGNIQAANEVVGFGGYGSFTQTSGNNIIASTLKLGELDTASGAYNLKSGSLSAAFEIIGDGGTGVVNQSGGNHSVANTLNIGLHGNGTYNLTGGVLSVAQEEIGGGGTGTFNQSGGKHTVAGSLVVSGLGEEAGASGTYNLTGGQLTAKNIVINGPFGDEGGNGHFNVMNTVTTVTGDVVNLGTVKTTNATVTWNGNFFNGGAYISDPSKQTFNKDLEVDRFGYIVGLTSQDLFIVKNDFLNHSVQNVNWNTAQAGLKFITGTDTSHTFAIAGDGTLSGHPFAWYSLDITGQTLRLKDGDTTADGAQWLQALIGAKFTGTTLTNIFNDDPDNMLNLYYDKNLAINAYLNGLNYTITGGAGGMLIAHTPLPPSVFLLGSGLLGLGLLGWRRKRLTS